MSPETGAARQTRVDPFAFPSDTTFRFVLLILSVLGASLFAFNWVYWSVHDVNRELAITFRCAREAGPVFSGTGDPTAYAARTSRLHACLAGLNHEKGRWILGAVGLLLLVALVVYAVWPKWKLWRGKLTPLTAEDAPEVVAYLDELCREAGVPTPRFVWNPLAAAASGLAFGRLGSRYVALSGGLVTTFYTDRDAFRAVVLHELAHLRNGDVDKTYFTMALWYSFLAIAVLPLLPTLHDEGAATIWRVSWRLAALVVLVYLSRNAVLRAREVYADVRASLAPNGAPGLERAVGKLKSSGRRLGIPFLHVHPSPKERLAALRDNDRLFRPGLWEAFGAGVVLTLVYHQLVTLITFYYTSDTGALWLAALIVAPFAAGVVVLGVWRGVFLATVRNATLSPLWRIGLALGAGFLIGEFLSLQNLASGSPTGEAPKALAKIIDVPPTRPVVGTALFGPGLVWGVIPLVSLLLFVFWIQTGARVWLERGGERTARWAGRLAILAAGAVLTVWTGIFFLLHDLLVQVAPVTARIVNADYDAIGTVTWTGPRFLYRLVMDPEAQYLGSRWPVVPAFALLWAFPLAAVAARARARSAPRARLFVGRALLVGAASGASAWILLLVLRARVHSGVDLSIRKQDTFILGFQYWQLSLAIATQVVASAVAAAVCPRLRIPHGLLAGFVGGVIGVAALLLSVTIGTCVRPLSLGASGTADCPFFVQGVFVRQVFYQVVGLGSALALVAALTTRGAVMLATGRREKRGPSD
jgi:Zn-dependent protease with chaperone function